MEVARDIFEVRYALPGLGYFLAFYIMMVLFIPRLLASGSETIWVALGAIAVVGSVPTGYLVQQLFLFLSFINGGSAHYLHIKKLGEMLRSGEIGNTILIELNHDKVAVGVSELRDELVKLGKEYVRRTHVWRHRELIETDGFLVALHDVMFLGSSIHGRYLEGGWTHSKVTNRLLLALVLGISPWLGVAFKLDPIAIGTTAISAMTAMILIPFGILALLGVFASLWTKADCDIKEEFLTWLHEMKFRADSQRKNGFSFQAGEQLVVQHIDGDRLILEKVKRDKS